MSYLGQIKQYFMDPDIISVTCSQNRVLGTKWQILFYFIFFVYIEPLRAYRRDIHILNENMTISRLLISRKIGMLGLVEPHTYFYLDLHVRFFLRLLNLFQNKHDIHPADLC